MAGRHTRRLVGMSSPASAHSTLNTLSVGSAGPRIAFLHGLFGQGRTPEVGVQYGAGQIEDAALRRLRHPRQPFAAIGEDGFDRGGLAAAAIRGKRAAHRIDNEGAAVPFNQGLSAG